MQQLIKNKDFKLFLDTLSVGWHLKCIAKNNRKMFLDEKNWNEFIIWLERHLQKNYKNYDKK